MELVSCYASGVKNFEMDSTYLENCLKLLLLLLLLLLLYFSASVVARSIESIIMGFAKISTSSVNSYFEDKFDESCWFLALLPAGFYCRSLSGLDDLDFRTGSSGPQDCRCYCQLFRTPVPFNFVC